MLHHLTVEGPWQTGPLCSGENVGWWMLDFARATAGDKLHHYCITCRIASKH